MCPSTTSAGSHVPSTWMSVRCSLRLLPRQLPGLFATDAVELDKFVGDFAEAMARADSHRPQAKSSRSGRLYQPGIGPFGEDKAVDQTVDEMRRLFPGAYDDLRSRVLYPGSRQRCDIVLGEPPTWAIEIKMARFAGDNGKPDDMATKDLISPFDCDRSAVSDCAKLASSRIAPNCALVIYGFDDPLRALDVMVEAFEALARVRVTLGTRYSAPLQRLVHPVFASGRVFGWRVSPK